MSGDTNPPPPQSESESEPSSHPLLVYRRMPTVKLLRIESCDCSKGSEHSKYE